MTDSNFFKKKITSFSLISLLACAYSSWRISFHVMRANLPSLLLSLEEVIYWTNLSNWALSIKQCAMPWSWFLISRSASSSSACHSRDTFWFATPQKPTLGCRSLTEFGSTPLWLSLLASSLCFQWPKSFVRECCMMLVPCWFSLQLKSFFFKNSSLIWAMQLMPLTYDKDQFEIESNFSQNPTKLLSLN